MKRHMQIRQLMLAGAAAVALTSGASAQDWSGFYVGVNGGGAMFNASGTTSDYYGSTGETSDWGGVVGGTAGYNWMAGSNVVLGIEGDMDWSGLSTSSPFVYGGTYYRSKSRWNWVGTIRGRAGFAMDNAFFYGTAGIALVGAKYTFCYYYTYSCAPSGSEENANSTTTEVGVTGGAGVEFMIDQDLSVDLSYLYIGLPSTGTTDGDGDPKKFNSSSSLVRVGVNFHLD